MKTTSKTLFIVMAFLAFMTTTAQAASWRINNYATKSSDFTSINAAMSSTNVVAGDTLILDPGTTLTEDQTITKQVRIVGCGYLQNDAPYTMATIIGRVLVKATKVKIEGVIFKGEVFLYADCDTLERCMATATVSVANLSGYRGSTHSYYSTIRQCYLTRVHGGLDEWGGTDFCTIENCIIRGGSASGSIGYLLYPTIKNCYIQQTSSSTGTKDSWILFNLNNPIIENNVMLNTGQVTRIMSGVSEAINKNNLFSSDGFTEADIFTLTGINDERYQLKEGSPALGAGTDGTDIGPSGGLYPYVLSGLPVGRPYYTKALISSRAENDKVNVSLKIKMQNE